MAGYKQSEAEQKAKIDKRVKDDMHRRLLELVYYLPFGYKAEYFYCMMSYLLPEDCFYLMPNRITKPILEIRAEREDRKAKAAEPKPEQTEEFGYDYKTFVCYLMCVTCVLRGKI